MPFVLKKKGENKYRLLDRVPSGEAGYTSILQFAHLFDSELEAFRAATSDDAVVDAREEFFRRWR